MNPSPYKAQATAIQNQEAAITPDVIGSLNAVHSPRQPSPFLSGQSLIR